MGPGAVVTGEFPSARSPPTHTMGVKMRLSSPWLIRASSSSCLRSVCYRWRHTDSTGIWLRRWLVRNGSGTRNSDFEIHCLFRKRTHCWLRHINISDIIKQSVKTPLVILKSALAYGKFVHLQMICLFVLMDEIYFVSVIMLKFFCRPQAIRDLPTILWGNAKIYRGHGYVKT